LGFRQQSPLIATLLNHDQLCRGADE